VQVIRRRGPGRINRWLTRLVGLVRGKQRAEARTRRLEQAAFTGALRELLERVVDPEAEAITLVAGAGANPEVTAAAVDWLKQYRAGIPVDVVDGGQPLYPYLVGVE